MWTPRGRGAGASAQLQTPPSARWAFLSRGAWSRRGDRRRSSDGRWTDMLVFTLCQTPRNSSALSGQRSKGLRCRHSTKGPCPRAAARGPAGRPATDACAGRAVGPGTRGSSPQRPPWSPLCSRRLGGDQGPERARVARRGGGGRRIRPGTPPTRGRPAGSWFLRLLCERVCPQLDGTGIEGASQAGLALRAPRALGCGPPATLGAPGRSGPRASVSSLATRGKGHRSFPLVIGGWRETRLAWRTPSAR